MTSVGAGSGKDSARGDRRFGGVFCAFHEEWWLYSLFGVIGSALLISDLGIWCDAKKVGGRKFLVCEMALHDGSDDI